MVLELFKAARLGPFTLNAFETFSDACLNAVIENRGLPKPFHSPSEAYVLMEVEPPFNADPEILENWLAGLFEKQLILDGRLALNTKETEQFWAYREGISESVMSLGYNHKNDIALPIAELESFVADFIPFMKTNYPEFRVFLFGHIGDGNLHINILKPDSLSLDEFLKHTHEVDRGLFTLVNKYKGSVSAEHGIGLLKKEALSYSRTPEEIAIFRKIKRVFDPKGLLNPGKIF
jgi:FAD/FMN-containing dehydrogenase